MENSKVKGVMGKTRDVAVWFWKDIRSYADVKGIWNRSWISSRAYGPEYRLRGVSC